MSFHTFCTMWRRLLALLLVALAAGCGSSGGASGPSASVTAPPRTTTTQARTPEQEVEAAYLRSWDVYAKAVRDLDASGLSESYAGDALTMVQQEVARLAKGKTPLVVRVEHDAHVQFVDRAQALVRDRYVNRNYRTSDGKPIDDPNNPGTYLETYQMKQVEGTWRVFRIVRESYQS